MGLRESGTEGDGELDGAPFEDAGLPGTAAEDDGASSTELVDAPGTEAVDVPPAIAATASGQLKSRSQEI